MTLEGTRKPAWLTFDCYGTLFQWDENLRAVIRHIAQRHHRSDLDPLALVSSYDDAEFRREQAHPSERFDDVAKQALAEGLAKAALEPSAEDQEDFVRTIPDIPPFPEVRDVLGQLKDAGFGLCGISNSADFLLAGNIAQLGGGLLNRAVTAEQAGAYKPDHRLFEYAWQQLGVNKADTCHICASPLLDHTVARDLGFRCIWIDRGTGRKPLDDYAPDLTLPSLARIPEIFRSLGWL